MSGPRIGLALGSGAARGWSHIGVIRALLGAGIEPEIVCGSSMGALVGAAYVAGRLDALEAWARSITRRDILGLLDLRLSGTGLIEGRRIMESFEAVVEDTPIEALPLPFAAVATNLATGREIWLREGSLREAVRASIALPGIFTPVQRGHRWLIDGGVVNPVPVSVCHALGAELIIAVNLNGEIAGRHGFRRRRARGAAVSEEARRPEVLGRFALDLPGALRERMSALSAQVLGLGGEGPGYFDVVFGAINIMQDRLTRSRLAGEPPDVLVMPRLAEFGLIEFHRATEAIAEGEAAVERILPALRVLVDQALTR